MNNRILTAALVGTLIVGLACEHREPFSPTSADHPQFAGRGGGSGVVVETVEDLVAAMESAAATGSPRRIKIKAGFYPLGPERLPRIHGDLRITGEGEKTIIDGVVPAFGFFPVGLSQRAVFDIVGGNVVIEKLVVRNGDVGIRVTDGTVIVPGTNLFQSHCDVDLLNNSNAHDVRNVRIEGVGFHNFLEAVRATTHGNESSLTGLNLRDLYFDNNVEGIVITNDCSAFGPAFGSVIDFTARRITVRNTRPEEPPVGPPVLTGIGLAAGNFGFSANGTVTGKVQGVTVDNDGPPSGGSITFCGGCFGAFAGTTKIDATDLTINNAEDGLQLLGGLASAGASVLNAKASDVRANTAGPGLQVFGAFGSPNNTTDAQVSDINLSGEDGPGISIGAGDPENSVAVDLSGARIDHFLGAIVFQGAAGNSVHATFTDVSHCGAGLAGQFFHFDGNAILTVDGQPEPGPLFGLPPCGS
jgi:hypothetical protein